MKLIPTVSPLFVIAMSVGAGSAAALVPKKIIVAFDGTGNNARDFEPNKVTDKSVSNVLKLHLLAGGDMNNRRNDVPGQISLYKRGVGGQSDSTFVKLLNTVRGNLRQQTVPMRKMLEEVYEEGDKIYIIGYSRGAAAARKFVTELDKKGLKTASNGNVEKPPVEFLGCFETVSMQLSTNLFKILRTKRKGTLTKSRVVGEKGGKLPSIVKTAVHNVALDDNRFRSLPMPFPPVFMDSGDNRVHEAWFAGEHGDIGGTYYVKGMPDYSCKYMQEWMESIGVSFIQPEEINSESLKIDDYPDVKLDKTDLDIVPKSADKLHLLPPQIKNPSHRPVVTVTNEEIIENGTVRIHVSVLEHLRAMEKANSPYKINPNIKETNNVIVVGSLDTVLEAETKTFKEILEL